MRIRRGLAAVVTATLIGGSGLAGCASTSSGTPRTVIVTETAELSTGGPTATTDVTVEPLPTGTDGSSTSASESSAETTPSSTAAPIVTVDPLKADCTKLMNPTELGRSFGQLPAGTDRIVEGANSERLITGRLKCQYGVADDKSTIAVQVVLAQFENEAAAKSQMATTVSSEKSLGATASTSTVQGRPAEVLLRDGGLLVLGYDTWTLSVVVEQGIVTDDKLPAALEAVADYSLTQLLAA